GRHGVPQDVAGDLAVVPQAGEVLLDPGQDEPVSRQGAAGALAAAAGDHGPGQERGDAGRAVQQTDADVAHHAPSCDWPQTRSTRPVTAALAGWANQAMVSATSTGWPPCCRELMRRPISRVATGILAVISASMNPGATALTVMPRAASRSSAPIARTSPTTPALEAA